ncbi:MAG: signal peptidase II [Desulfovibrionaceae bacterium]|nr:signal peptidase II [Desulfovibrionaceae bacterium]
MRSRWKVLLATAPCVLVLDQLTKWLVNRTLPLNGGVPVIDGLFNLVNIRNRGAAFGFLNRSDIDWQVWLFLAATLAASGIICALIHKSGRAPLLWVGLSMVLGGAFGNLIDRLRERAVTDFLDFYWGEMHWPAFNVADIAICVGAGLTALAILLGHDRRDLPEAGRKTSVKG